MNIQEIIKNAKGKPIEISKEEIEQRKDIVFQTILDTGYGVIDELTRELLDIYVNGKLSTEELWRVLEKIAQDSKENTET
ncbi:MAG: hypothetical protein V3U92_18280 [Cellulophaga sp.]